MTVFADTAYWIALYNERDELHPRAVQAANDLQDNKIYTSEDVLAEFLTYFCEYGRYHRERVTVIVRELLNNDNIEIFYQSHNSFIKGLEFYESRHDKKYSYCDCVSMATMYENEIRQVLTGDDDFIQEGFEMGM